MLGEYLGLTVLNKFKIAVLISIFVTLLRLVL